VEKTQKLIPSSFLLPPLPLFFFLLFLFFFLLLFLLVLFFNDYKSHFSFSLNFLNRNQVSLQFGLYEGNQIILIRAIWVPSTEIGKITVLQDSSDLSGVIEIFFPKDTASFLSRSPSSRAFRECPDFTSGQLQGVLRLEFERKRIPRDFGEALGRDPVLKYPFLGLHKPRSDPTIPALFTDPILVLGFLEAVKELQMEKDPQDLLKKYYGMKEKFDEIVIQKEKDV